MPPQHAGPSRVAEQELSAKIVGVDDVTFLGDRDGVVECDLALRRDLAREIRRTRPDVLLIATYDPTYRLARGQRVLNQADHRAVGIAALEAGRDSWEPLDLPGARRRGSRAVARGASRLGDGLQRTHPRRRCHRHTLDAGIESLQAHRTYLDGLGRDFDPAEFLCAMTTEPGRALGVRNAVAFGRVQLTGV